MKPSDIAAIEESLSVKLPEAYRLLMCGSDAPRFDSAGLFDEVALIVDRTKEQRQGYGGAPRWPHHLVYIGDQEDACPYALDTQTGVITQTDHGNLTKEPLARYAGIQELSA